MGGIPQALCLGLLLIVLCSKRFITCNSNDADMWTRLQLPEEHMPYYFHNNKPDRKQCFVDPECLYNKYTKVRKCWGYEQNCAEKERMYMPECPGFHQGWVRTKDNPEEAHINMFWTEADFGYIKERKDELAVMCQPQFEEDSSLHCSKYLRYCQAKNIYMDFRNFTVSTEKNNRYREDVFDPGAGQIGGHCKMFNSKLAAENEHKSPLQSWYAELQHYDALPFKPIEDGHCDVVFDKPTILIKLDAGVNMYHHFCDFINLYASQHLNNSFSLDVQIIMWDTSPMRYGDFFHDTWKAFSYYPYIHLNTLAGKRVCFRNAVFSLLARMRRGMYYNMPLVPGCHSSSLFRAFSQHVLHRLNITQEGPLKDKIRITLLSRSTKFRKILNQDELVAAMKKVPEYDVRVVDFNGKYEFLDQLQVTHNSDVFIGMHGAGLTHMLFQPDWGVIFEIYHCEDERCYSDLARLRGLHYMTWDDMPSLMQEDEGHHPTLGAHAKFTNYGFGVKEFMRKIAVAAKYVRGHRRYQEAWENLYGEQKQEHESEEHNERVENKDDNERKEHSNEQEGARTVKKVVKPNDEL